MPQGLRALQEDTLGDDYSALYTLLIKAVLMPLFRSRCKWCTDSVLSNSMSLYNAVSAGMLQGDASGETMANCVDELIRWSEIDCVLDRLQRWRKYAW